MEYLKLERHEGGRTPMAALCNVVSGANIGGAIVSLLAGELYFAVGYLIMSLSIEVVRRRPGATA